jgi:hypothetical protein
MVKYHLKGKDAITCCPPDGKFFLKCVDGTKLPIGTVLYLYNEEYGTIISEDMEIKHKHQGCCR